MGIKPHNIVNWELLEILITKNYLMLVNWKQFIANSGPFTFN